MTVDVPPSPEKGSIADPDQLPKHTTPTWEVELLISGVAVFAMLQLPGWIDDRYFDLLPRLDVDWAELLKIGYLYARVGALILAGTFVFHLLLRSHWIALVGMGSVYPRGVLWERLRMGAQRRQFEQTLMGDIPAAIERADNRATVVFATGVYLALQMLKLVVLIAVGSAIMWIVERWSTFHPEPTFVFYLMAAIIVPLILANWIDRHAGDRIKPGSTGARVLYAVFSCYARIGLGRTSSSGMQMMISNEGYRRALTLILVIVAAACLTTIYQLEQDKNPSRFGSYGLLPPTASDAPDLLDPAHYDDQRGNERLGTAPFLPSQVISDPWLRLTIPIRPGVHNAAMQRACPALVQAMESASDATASARSRAGLLACLSAMHPLVLDAHPLPGVRYDLGVDAKAQRPALVAMIDVRALANGRHDLLVGEPNQAGGRTTTPDRIAFWR